MDIDGELKAELEGEEGEEGRWGMRVRVVWVVDVDVCWLEEDMRVMVDEGIGGRLNVEADGRAWEGEGAENSENSSLKEKSERGSLSSTVMESISERASSRSRRNDAISFLRSAFSRL